MLYDSLFDAMLYWKGRFICSPPDHSVQHRNVLESAEYEWGWYWKGFRE
jgi:hypothetical protein